LLISSQQKKILALLADGSFHSGSALAEVLGISRSAIWKQLQGLTALGLQYAAVRGKGYRLARPLALLESATIHAVLSEQATAFISALEIHDHIDSTNSHVMARSRADAPSGLACFAEYQTAGKGRRGRHWVSPYGHNIYVSLLWRFQNSGLAAIAGLSLAIGVAVMRALKQLDFQGIELKWPNDIYFQGKKLGGILIEVSGETEGPCAAVIGLGLNLFLPESEATAITQAWTDLSQVSGEPPALVRNKLAGVLLNQMVAVTAEFETLGMSAYVDEWRRYDCLRGKIATLFVGKQQLSGLVEGIDDHGLLLMKFSDGSVQAFASGEVSFSGSAR
jgi:BirA family biotin operon repressor/biotin-[acetyl-CoA-carboxylase] ligase